MFEGVAHTSTRQETETGVSEQLNDLALCQHTLNQEIRCQGIGLHTGRDVSMTLLPAPAGTGIVFRRLDIPGPGGIIPARYDLVAEAAMCTRLMNDANVSVYTVEHLMAALYSCGVDNLFIELDGPEVPVMDGSAAPFVRMIKEQGLRAQPFPRRVITVRRAVEARKGQAYARLAPGSGLSLKMEIDFSDPAIGAQALALDMNEDVFRRELATARTFGFIADVESLQQKGLARGASLDNAVGIADGRVVNPGGLRFPDECVRHKMLDCIGDMALSGGLIQGRYHGVKASHAVNNLLLRALFADSANWSVNTVSESSTPSFRELQAASA